MISAEEMIAGLQEPLSLRHRIRSLVELFGAGVMVLLVTALWWTEEGLPGRTQAAFAGLIAFGVLIAVRAGYVLRRRGRLFARDRVIAGWLAAGFAVALAVGLALAGLGLLGAPVVVIAVGFLLFTEHRRRRLRREVNR